MSYSPIFGGLPTLLVDRNPMERVITRLIKKLGKRAELMLTLNGAAAGSAASATRSRVAHSTTELGGVRAIETYTEVSRNTTAADKTDIDNLLSVDSRVATPTDGAGSWDV